MADPSPGSDLDPGDSASPAGERGGGRGAPPGTPRWVKVTGIVMVVLAVLVIVMLLLGHGPQQHTTGAPVGPGAPVGAVVGLSGPGARG